MVASNNQPTNNERYTASPLNNFRPCLFLRQPPASDRANLGFAAMSVKPGTIQHRAGPDYSDYFGSLREARHCFLPHPWVNVQFACTTHKFGLFALSVSHLKLCRHRHDSTHVDRTCRSKCEV